jgi:acyl carrier protein
MPTKAIESQEELEQQIIQAIHTCLEASGRDRGNITLETVPLKDLKDFDSLCAIEVVVDLEGRLATELGEDLFVQGSGKNAKLRSVRGIAETILRRASKKKGGTE